MRVAVFSDVHGNLSGLTAVLDAIHRHGVDRTIFAGDLCFAGPQPAACLKAVSQLGIDSLYGNTDEWVIGRQPPPDKFQALADWTLDKIGDNGRKWLARLPFSQNVSPTDNPTDDLLIVHANPVDVNQVIFPPESNQYKRYNQIRQPDTALADLLADTTSNTIAFGHLHIPNVRRLRDKTLINISSVAIPGDHDPRAKYTLFTWRNGRWLIEQQTVSFARQPEIEAYQAYQPPGWETAVAEIQTNGYQSQNV